MYRIWFLALALNQSGITSAQIPVDFFGGLALDEPLPTNFTTGEVVTVSGRVTNPNIPAISLEFRSSERIVEHRIRVVRGHFEHPVLFTHEETGNYFPQVIFFPLTGDLILSRVAEQVKVRLGSGKFSFPPAYFENWLDPARFVPHAIELSDDLLPPLFVRTGGSPSKVFVVISGDYDRRDEYEVFDNGLDADLIAGDGIYTLAPRAVDPDLFSEFHGSTDSVFGKIDAVAIVQYREGILGFTTQCGVVDGPLSRATALDEGVRRTDFVLNIVEPDILVFQSEPGVDVSRASRRFYDYFRDSYDFLVVRSALPLANGLHGNNTKVKNEIQGIGLEIFDNTGDFGSDGRLRGVTVINFRHVGPLVHEVAHNWANFLERFESQKYGAHWGFTDVQGVLGGYATHFEELRTGRYAVSGGALTSFWGGRYGLLELYLMGLLPASEVPGHTVLGNSRILGVDDEANAIIVSGALEQVTIDDIVAKEGPRIPGFEESQKAFRMGTVVVSDRPLTPVELTYMDRQTAFFGSDADDPLAFAFATGFRATMDTRLDHPITAVLESEVEQARPATIRLSQNYPNPFNASTSFLIELDGRRERTPTAFLEIFSVNGQLVRRMEITDATTDPRLVTWDGRDNWGREAASGIYIAIARRESLPAPESPSRRLTLLR